jgi:hypothetical protein
MDQKLSQTISVSFVTPSNKCKNKKISNTHITHNSKLNTTSEISKF